MKEEFNGKQIVEWFAQGGRTEDEPDGLLRTAINLGRSNNHFHNPLLTWDKAGLDVWPYSGQSSILWAQNPDQKYGGRWSWQDARRYYHEALTSVTRSSKEAAFANTFRALGQLMHLVQDASVPAHVRNDVHLLPNYETWVKKIQLKEKTRFDGFVQNPISFDRAILNRAANPLAPIPIAQIIDTDQYIGNNPQVTFTKAVGIAEFANANFFSEDTISNDQFPHPRVPDLGVLSYLIPDPRGGSDPVLRQYYIYQGMDEVSSYRLALVSFLKEHLDEVNVTYSPDISLDGWVYNDYASLLLPRAVGYSAGLLEYFFRGKIQVGSLPIFYNNGLYLIKVKIKNMTPNEDMRNGYFILTYRYTPPGGAEDGSGDILNYAFSWDGSLTVACTELKSGEEMEVYFRVFYDRIPAESLNSLKFSLAFRGMLGNESEAVVGKVFGAGTVLFNEEWDRGLHGNHTWRHMGVDEPYPLPESGMVSNVAEDGFLRKDHLIFKPVMFSLNASGVGLSSGTDKYQDVFPILVTADTYLQFKVDEMSISYSPAPPSHGWADHYQCMRMDFTNGLSLLFSQGEYDPVVDPTRTAHYTFSLGAIIVDNIYRLFQGAGITLPDGPLYLNSIGFHQLLFYTQKDIEYRERMKVDFVRIVEGKEE